MAHFWPIFPIFGTQNFLENLALSHTTSYGFLAPCQNLKKVSDTIQRKCPDRQKDRRTVGRIEGQKDGRTDRLYFIGAFRLPPGIQKQVQALEFLKPNTQKVTIKDTIPENTLSEDAKNELNNDQSNLLVEILNFRKQVKPKNLEKKTKEKKCS